MNEEARRSRVRSFLLGGIVGGIAGLVAGRMRAQVRPPRRSGPAGLAAFERAPCYEELLECERREGHAPAGAARKAGSARGDAHR